jgi:hypothetical protein
MPRVPITLVLLVVCSAAVGCQTRVTRYSVLATRQVDVSRLTAPEADAPAIEGSTGFAMLGKIPLSTRGLADEVSGRSSGTRLVDQALSRALKKHAGAVALADARVTDTGFAIPFLWEYRSCKVRGRPVLDTPAPADASVTSAAITPDRPAP